MKTTTLTLEDYLRAGNAILKRYPKEALFYKKTWHHAFPQFTRGKMGGISYLASSGQLLAITMNYCEKFQKSSWNVKLKLQESNLIWGLTLEELHIHCPTLEEWETLLVESIKYNIINNALT